MAVDPGRKSWKGLPGLAQSLKQHHVAGEDSEGRGAAQTVRYVCTCMKCGLSHLGMRGAKAPWA